MFNINDFKSTLNLYNGPAKNNLFQVEISAAESSYITNSDLRFFCESVTLPGVNLQLTDYLPNSFGLIESMPGHVTPERLNALFIVDSNHAVTAFFHEWMQKIVNYNSDNPFEEDRGRYPYEIAYKSEYAATISVKHYSTHDKNKYYLYTFYKAFPTEIGTETLSWAPSDSHMQLPVNFAYSGMKFKGNSS